METEFATADLHLATWLMYQEGAECLDIKTQPGRGERLRSTFVIDTSNCTRSLQSLLQAWRSGQALVEIRQYEQARRGLLENMYAMHRAYTGEESR